MTTTLRSITVLALAGAALAASPLCARERLTGEQQLAKMLEGRVAGKPVDCVSLTALNGTTIIDKTAIVYEAMGTLYVNRPDFPQSLSDDDILVTKTWGSQLCKLDIVQLYTRGGPSFWHGSVGLNQFVPYTKVKKPAVVPTAASAPAPAPEATPAPAPSPAQ